jgi:3-oxoacyl-[acyl-carrier-protein] synthase I
MSYDVHIVAFGARTPVGLTAESSAAAIRAGIARVGEHPFMVDSGGDKLKCGRDSLLAPDTFGADRMALLACSTLREVADKLTANSRPIERLPVVLALPESRPGFGQADPQVIERALRTQPVPNVAKVTVELAGDGHAGVLYGLTIAMRHVVEGRHALCVVAGVDSYFHADTLDWLDADRRIGRAEIRSGFPPAEGAAMLAVTSNATRLRLGLPSLARIRGVACTRERRSRLSHEGLLGEGLTDAINRAATNLASPGEVLDDVYCDINGERDRTDDWGFALLRTSSLFRDGTAYTMTANQCGDMGASSAALNCVLAAQAWQRGYAHGALALVWGASWGGLRGAVVLERGAN